MAILSKLLTKTDIEKRLSVPIKSLKFLPPFRGGHEVDFQATDESGHSWAFRCSTRKKKHKKPVLSRGDWLAFVRNKKLKIGDKINFYKYINHATGESCYRVQAEKEIKIFGAIFGYEPIVATFP